MDIFQTDWKTPSASDLLKTKLTGKLSTSRHHFKINTSILSGPDSRVVDNKSSAVWIFSEETEIKNWKSKN